MSHFQFNLQPALPLSDILPDLKRTALAGFDASHNATFPTAKLAVSEVPLYILD
jgi:hypothetical protein